MNYTIEISNNLAYCFTEEQIRDIVSDVFRNRSHIGQDNVVIATSNGYVQADRDDMYNISIYGAEEDTMDAETFQTAAMVEDDDEIRFMDLDMPTINEVEVNGERYALTEDAYHCSMLWIGDNRYTAMAVNRKTGRTSRVYWDIINPDAEEEADMCDWENPCLVERI